MAKYTDFTIEDAKQLLVSKLKKLSERDSGYRDLSTLLAAFVKLEKDMGRAVESQWWQSIRELKETYEACEELSLEGFSEKYESIFENKNKKKVLLHQ